MRIWIITYRLRIRRKWHVWSLAADSLTAAESRWDDVKSTALRAGQDYDLIYKSDANGDELQGSDDGCGNGIEACRICGGTQTDNDGQCCTCRGRAVHDKLGGAVTLLLLLIPTCLLTVLG